MLGGDRPVRKAVEPVRVVIERRRELEQLVRNGTTHRRRLQEP